MKDLLSIYESQNEFGRYMGMDFKVIEPGKVEYAMQIGPEHIALNDMAHGGAIAGFMDAIVGVTGLTAVAQNQRFVSTVEFKISFLNGAPLGSSLTGYGHVIKLGKRLLTIEGRIQEGDNLIAIATSTLTSYPASKIISPNQN